MDLNDLHQTIGSMDGKLDMILTRLDKGEEQNSERFEAIEARTTKLEGWQNRVLGGAAVVISLAGFIKLFIL
jgi:hypothetical protein